MTSVLRTLVDLAGRLGETGLARGDELRRYTPDDLFEDPHPMLGELRALLG